MGALAVLRLGLAQVDDVQLVESAGFYPDEAVIAGRRHGHKVEHHRRRQPVAVLVVGVVAAQLGAARCRKDAHLFPFPIKPGKLLQQAQTALPLRQRVIGHIQPAQCLITGTALQGFFPLGRSWHRSFLRQFRVKRISTGLWSE